MKRGLPDEEPVTMIQSESEKWTYIIQRDTEWPKAARYQVMVVAPDGQRYYGYRDTRWGCRRRARRIKKQALAESVIIEHGEVS